MKQKGLNTIKVNVGRKNMAIRTASQAEVSVAEKCLLTIEEAARYTGIGIHKLRELSNLDGCDFILWNGSKRMFKREKLKSYLYGSYSI